MSRLERKLLNYVNGGAAATPGVEYLHGANDAMTLRTFSPASREPAAPTKIPGPHARIEARTHEDH
jgi:hypothetical protein